MGINDASIFAIIRSLGDNLSLPLEHLSIGVFFPLLFLLHIIMTKLVIFFKNLPLTSDGTSNLAQLLLTNPNITSFCLSVILSYCFIPPTA